MKRYEYTVAVTHEGKWWVGRVDGVVGAATEVACLADLETEVRDLLAGLLDADDDDFDLSWDLSGVIGADGQAAWAAYRTDRDDLSAIQAKFEADRLETLRALRDAGVSVRDSATLVGLSHQRVAQLIAV